MVFKEDIDVFNFIRDNLKVKPWIGEARTQHKLLDALVTGKDFKEVLIKRIEKIESEDRAKARVRYSKDIRDFFDRVMQPRANIFTASGGSIKNDIKQEEEKKRFNKALAHFKGQKSMSQYLAENFFRLQDTDPNGLIFLEYVEQIDISPTYKSINDIRFYVSNGQLLEVLLFEPETKVVGDVSHVIWRVVDDKKDYRVIQKGDEFTVIEDLTFEHPFGKVPATILSDVQIMGSEVRISPIWSIEQIAQDYARDKSILTIYKFQNGMPRHWRYKKSCRECHGTGKTGDDNGACNTCNGKGDLRRNDITDITEIELPREDEPIVTPNIEGFVSPDLDTWKQYKEDLRDMEDSSDATMWGTTRIKGSGTKTATESFINVQPVMNKLNRFADNVEFTDNQLADWVENWAHGQPKEQSEYHKTYGRRFIIESPDVILDKYTIAREKGDNTTILDKLLDEYILSVYQTNPTLLQEMQKKRIVEPLIHLSVTDVNTIFGADRTNQKVLFVDFWEQADKDKTVEQLAVDRDKYFTDNNTVVSQPTE